MTKHDILIKLSERIGAEKDETRKAKLQHIRDLIEILLDYDIEKEIPEIENYLNDRESVIEGDILVAIIDRLEERIRRNSSKVESGRMKNEAISVGVAWLSNHRGVKFTVSSIFIVSLALVSLAVLILSILESTKAIPTDGILAGICGGLDFVCGVGFFIYEWVSDKKEKEMSRELSNITGIVYYKSKIKTGDNANFGIIINRSNVPVDDSNKKAEMFILKYNRSKIKAGDDANFGIRDEESKNAFDWRRY